MVFLNYRSSPSNLYPSTIPNESVRGNIRRVSKVLILSIDGAASPTREANPILRHNLEETLVGFESSR